MFFYLNPGFVDSIGHHLSHHEAISGLYGDDLIVAANKKLQVDGLPYKITKCFQLNTWQYISDGNRLNAFKQDLNNLKSYLTDGDTVFMYMSDVLFITPIIDFILINNLECKVILNLFHTGRFFSNSPQHTDNIFAIFQYTRDIRERIGMRIVVDTESLQDILYKNTGERFPILPMFHSIDLNIQKTQRNNKKVISFLSASKEKGLQEFVRMIILFKTKEPELFSKADFRVRVLVRTQDNLSLVQKISSIAHLTYGPLSAEEYEKVIAETDIMMLPYLSNYFQFRTSGVFTDALLNSIPVISTKKTWIGYHTENNRIGEVFDETDINDFCHALKKMLCNYQFYKDNIAAAKENWVKYHSIENFHRLVTSCDVGRPQDIDGYTHKIYKSAKKAYSRLIRNIFDERSIFELFRNRFSRFISIQTRPIEEK